MLLLKEAHVFLIMGSAIAIAAVGVRVLRASGARSLVTHEVMEWRVERPATRHVAGSSLFALGWTVAGTCPGPVAAMIGQGRVAGVAVAVGLLAGVALQRVLVVKPKIADQVAASATAGL